MLIDHYLPEFDFTEIHGIQVNAPPAVTYDAIRRADLRDPLIATLLSIREAPERLASRLRGEPPKRMSDRFTFADMERPGTGFVLLAEEPGTEFVAGSVGRFWKRNYGWQPVTTNASVGFAEPGSANLAVGFSVRPAGYGESTLRYEARTSTTDEEARKRFRRYWRLIRPGVAIVMRRALHRIKAEVEGTLVTEGSH